MTAGLDLPHLFLDLYQLTMSQSYWRTDPNKEATFELSFRSLPKDRNYLVIHGIERALKIVSNLSFDDESIKSLRGMRKFDESFLNYLSEVRFTGSARTMSDGDIAFAGEPVFQIKAPIIQGQLLETVLINTINLRTLLATKCSRVIHAARGKPVVDFGARRAHGIEAGEALSEASYLAGFSGTATVSGGIGRDIPLVGTMAHSYIMSFESELDAFRAYAKEFPSECTLLVDTYDTSTGIENAVKVGKEMDSVGERLKAIRLDSGDFLTHATNARAAFEKAALSYVNILASGGLDEYEIDRLEREYAPIDGYGVGTKVSVSSDAPWSESVYKMVEIDGVPVFKSSEDKRSLPHQKSVHRESGFDGLFVRDTISASGTASGTRNVRSMLRNRLLKGERVIDPVSIQSSRNYHISEIARLPDKFKNLRENVPYPVEIILPGQTDPL